MSSEFQKQLQKLNATGPVDPYAAPLREVHKNAVQDTTVDASPTLEGLWKQSHAVMVDESGEFVSLKIKAKARPISLTEGDGWLAWVKPEGKKYWNVGIWKRTLAGFTHICRNEEKGQAAIAILNFTHGLKPEHWIVVDALLPSTPKNAQPPATPETPSP